MDLDEIDAFLAPDAGESIAEARVIDMLRTLRAEVERLRECLRRAGRRAFMRGRPPEEVAAHLEEIAASWAEVEVDLSSAEADLETLRAAAKRAVYELQEHLDDGCAGPSGDARRGACHECLVARGLEEALALVDGGEVDRG